MIRNLKIKIGFVGLSHLGLTYLTAAAEKGFKVSGFDINRSKINNLKNTEMDLAEPNLKSLIKKNFKKITFTNDIKDLEKNDLIFLSQDVPVLNNGKSDYSIIYKYINLIKKNIKKNAVLIILSQVSPSFTRSINWNKSKLFYQVETLVFGNALERAIHPERIIIGQYDKLIKTNAKLINFYKNFNCPIIKMNYESAELCKISINLFLISSLTYANKLSEICENLNANWTDIVSALRLDKRIGTYSYLNPGFGLSGGNLIRDLFSIKQLSKQKKIESSLFDNFFFYSNYFKKWCLKKIKKIELKKNDSICMLGISYKENTLSTKNSQALYLLKHLKEKKIFLHDPYVDTSIFCKISKNYYQTNDFCLSIKNSKIILILVPWNSYKKINSFKNISIFKNKIIFDPFKVITNSKIINLAEFYLTLGTRNEI